MKRSEVEPIRLVHLTLLGAAILFTLFATELLPFAFGNSILERSLNFVGPIAGIGLWINRFRLSYGIQRDRWTEDQLEVARRFIAQRWLSTTQTILIVGALASGLAFMVLHLHSVRDFVFLAIYAWILPDLTCLRRQPLLSETRRLIENRPHVDWGSFKPIQSSHWGEPPAKA